MSDDRAVDDTEDWHWRVVLYTEERGKLILGAYGPHRAAAKKYVADRLEASITGWKRTYVVRPSWDCPVCGTHEGATKMPNLRGDHDWECFNCGSKLWGEPMDWERVDRGPWAPKSESKPEQVKLDEANRW